jgi:hypothetical protein
MIRRCKLAVYFVWTVGDIEPVYPDLPTAVLPDQCARCLRRHQSGVDNQGGELAASIPIVEDDWSAFALSAPRG